MNIPNEATKVQSISEEKLIHSELVSLFLETSESGYVDLPVWSRVNELLQQLSSKILAIKLIGSIVKMQLIQYLL